MNNCSKVVGSVGCINFLLVSAEAAVGGFMVANTEFKILNKTTSLDRYIRTNIIPTIPSVHRDLKIHLLDESYSLVKTLLQSSFNKGNVRNKYLNDLIVNIALVDYLLGEISEINNNKKKCLVAIKQLSDIKNMVYAWKSNIDEKNSS